jgi:hypothetical protein
VSPGGGRQKPMTKLLDASTGASVSVPVSGGLWLTV